MGEATADGERSAHREAPPPREAPPQRERPPRGEKPPHGETPADETVEDRCVRRLREQGLRPTRPRLAVYRVLAQAGDHPTAAEVEKRVRNALPDISTATVYNCLEALQSAGLVGVMNEVHRAARYDAVTDRHHHLVCRSCGRITDLHDPELDRLAPADDRGFEIGDHSVHFYGLCPDCAEER